MTQPQAVCEISESFIRLAHLKPLRKAPRVDVLGLAEVPSEGMRDGHFHALGDLAECLWVAARTCQKQSGWASPNLIMSLDDPFLESVKVQGVSYLDSESESFQPEHIEEARRKAIQSLAPQDKHLVYEKEAGFLIDRKDYIHDPVGICGKELTVILHLLFSESTQVQELRRLVERAGLKVKKFVPSGLAGAFGALERNELVSRSVVVLANRCVCHVVTVEYGSVQDYQSFLVEGEKPSEEMISRMGDFIRKANLGDPTRLWVTGEMALDESWISSMEASLGRQMSVGTLDVGNPDLSGPRHAVLLGLSALSRTQRRKPPEIKTLQVAAHSIRNRVSSFIQEYF